MTPHPLPVISGGVGESGRTAIEQVQEDYNTKLIFTGNSGFYLANVAVSIRDSNGVEVVNGLADGPILLADLQPGRYTVLAEADGIQKTRSIAIGKRLNTYHLRFPLSDNTPDTTTESLSEDDNRERLIERLESKGYDMGFYFPG